MRIFDFGLSQTLAVRLVKVPEAFTTWQLICPMMRLTKYLSQSIQISLHFSISLPSILIDDGIYVPWIRTLVFLKLMIRSNFEHADEKRLLNVFRFWPEWATSAASSVKKDHVHWSSSPFSSLLDLQNWKDYHQFLYGAYF